MAEYIADALQSVAAGQNVLFTDDVIPGNYSILHRKSSGIVTLRGLTNQCRARYKVFFNGNIGIPTGGAVGAISAAITLAGEPLSGTSMVITPAAVLNYFNVSAETFIDVPIGCCSNISIENTSSQAINVENANLIVERVA